MLKKTFLLLLSFIIIGCSLEKVDDNNIKKKPVSEKTSDLEPDILDIVISEIAWAGTDTSFNDEWIELYNNTPDNIDLGEWSIRGDLDIDLTGDIPAQSYFLLERSDESTVPDLSSDKIYVGVLNNTGGELYLLYKDLTIDQIVMPSWAAGSNDPKLSMERIILDATADDLNWQNGIGDIEGARNSIF